MKRDVLALAVGALGASAFWVGASCRATAPSHTTALVAPPGAPPATEPYGLAGVRVHSDDTSALAWVEACPTCVVDRFDIYYLRTAASGALGWRIDDGAWQSLPTQLTAPVVASLGSAPTGPGLPP